MATVGDLSGLYGYARRAPAGLVDFLRDRGDLWPAEASLCIVAWCAERAGRPGVTSRELCALARAPEVPSLVPRLKFPADALRSCADSGLAEVVGPDELPDDFDLGRYASRVARAGRGPCYRPTALGRAVAAALPDRRRVAALCGVKTFRRTGAAGPTERRPGEAPP